MLGEQGLHLYIQHKQTIWDALPPLPAHSDWDKKYPYLRLSDLLIAHAKANNNTTTEIAILEKTVTCTTDCIKLCERLIELDLWPQVDAWLSKAKQWQKKSPYPHNQRGGNTSLEQVELKLYLHKGDTPSALKKQWEIYQTSPNVKHYDKLLDLAEQCGEHKKWRDKVFDTLHAAIEKPDQQYFMHYKLDHLIQLYLHENKPDSALTVVNTYKVNERALHAVIKSFHKQPTITLPLYQRLVDMHIRQGNNDAYKQGITFLVECKKSLQNQAHKNAFALIEEELRTRHKAKRNFIKYLNEAMG
ncbi:hypothetical protein ACVBE9_03765 [Eionea flava]